MNLLMNICTMHGNLKKVQNFGHLHIPQYQWWNCNFPFIWIPYIFFNPMMQLFSKLFLTKLTRILIWYDSNYIENYRRILYKNRSPKYLLVSELWNLLILYAPCFYILAVVQGYLHKIVPMDITRWWWFILYMDITRWWWFIIICCSLYISIHISYTVKSLI